MAQLLRPLDLQQGSRIKKKSISGKKKLDNYQSMVKTTPIEKEKNLNLFMKTKSQTVNVRFEIFFTPDGVRTCSSRLGHNCKFLGFKKFGTQPVCMACGEDIDRDSGWISPIENCILKGSKS